MLQLRTKKEKRKRRRRKMKNVTLIKVRTYWCVLLERSGNWNQNFMS
jgi:hypothetical protein